jgi:hypothetical protein
MNFLIAGGIRTGSPSSGHFVPSVTACVKGVTRISLSTSILALGVLGAGLTASGCTHATPPGGVRRSQVPVGEVGGRYVLVGQLGHPIGTYLTLEGTTPAVAKDARLLVDTVDGRRLSRPVSVELRQARGLPANGRVVLRGFEDCGMIGSRFDPADAPGGEPQAHFRFDSWIEVFSIKSINGVAQTP